MGEPIYWKVNDEKIFPIGGEFYAYFPQFSWCTEYVKANTEWEIEAIISSDPASLEWPSYPCILDAGAKFPSCVSEIQTFMEKSKVGSNISLSTEPSPIALRIKKLIDVGFCNDIKIEKIAEKLKSSNAHISRQFKASYGFSPNSYKKTLKVSVATIALSSGKTPIESAAMSGYHDLSRFYKQFGELMKSTPSKHQGFGQ